MDFPIFVEEAIRGWPFWKSETQTTVGTYFLMVIPSPLSLFFLEVGQTSRPRGHGYSLNGPLFSFPNEGRWKSNFLSRHERNFTLTHSEEHSRTFRLFPTRTPRRLRPKISVLFLSGTRQEHRGRKFHPFYSSHSDDSFYQWRNLASPSSCFSAPLQILHRNVCSFSELNALMEICGMRAN